MSRTYRLGIIVLALLTAPAALAAEESTPLPAEGQWEAAMENGALWYSQAFLFLPADGLLTDEERDFLQRVYRDPRAEAPATLAGRLHLLDEAFKAAERGAAQPYCHFAEAREAGPDCMMPHMRPLRDLVAWLAIDARAALEAGETARATRRLATVYRLANHIGTGGPLIGVSVGRTFFATADSIVEQALEEGRLDVKAKARLLAVLETMGEDNPLGFAFCMQREREITSQWMLRACTGRDGLKRFHRLMNMLVGDEARTSRALMMMASQIEESAAHYDGLMQRAAAAFADPDLQAGAAEIERLAQETEAASESDHRWLIAKVMRTDFRRAHGWYRDFVDDLAARKASLIDRSSGPSPSLDAAASESDGEEEQPVETPAVLCFHTTDQRLVAKPRNRLILAAWDDGLVVFSSSPSIPGESLRYAWVATTRVSEVLDSLYENEFFRYDTSLSFVSLRHSAYHVLGARGEGMSMHFEWDEWLGPGLRQNEEPSPMYRHFVTTWTQARLSMTSLYPSSLNLHRYPSIEEILDDNGEIRGFNALDPDQTVWMRRRYLSQHYSSGGRWPRASKHSGQ